MLTQPCSSDILHGVHREEPGLAPKQTEAVRKYYSSSYSFFFFISLYLCAVLCFSLLFDYLCFFSCFRQRSILSQARTITSYSTARDKLSCTRTTPPSGISLRRCKSGPIGCAAPPPPPCLHLLNLSLPLLLPLLLCPLFPYSFLLRSRQCT